MEFKMFNNLKDFSEHIWFDTLRKISKERIITIDNMLLLRNIAVHLKDKEKLKELFEIIKMLYISINGDEKIEKMLKLLDDDIKSETWGENVLNI